MSLPICIQSSLVGLIIIATGPSPSSKCAWSKMCLQNIRLNFSSSADFVMIHSPKHWKYKRRCLATARFCDSNQIPARHYRRYCLTLNGSWLLETQLFQNVHFFLRNSTMSPSLHWWNKLAQQQKHYRLDWVTFIGFGHPLPFTWISSNSFLYASTSTFVIFDNSGTST